MQGIHWDYATQEQKDLVLENTESKTNGYHLQPKLWQKGKFSSLSRATSQR
jgi:hypothetical protein